MFSYFHWMGLWEAITSWRWHSHSYLVLNKSDSRTVSPWLHCVRTHWKLTMYISGSRTQFTIESVWALILKLPDYKIVKNKFLLFREHPHCYIKKPKWTLIMTNWEFFDCWCKHKILQLQWMYLLSKLLIVFTLDPALSFRGAQEKKGKSIHTPLLYTRMSMLALLRTAQNWKWARDLPKMNIVNIILSVKLVHVFKIHNGM